MRSPIPAGSVVSSREAAVMEVNTIRDPVMSSVRPSHLNESHYFSSVAQVLVNGIL